MFASGAGLEAVITGIIGLGGMMLGGFVVYHRVEGLVKEMKAEICRVDLEAKDELKQVWAKFDLVQLKEVCVIEKRTCLVEFRVFREGHDEIKMMFKDLRGDIKAELKLLRDCISQATAGKC
jgi:hypothetical protein